MDLCVGVYVGGAVLSTLNKLAVGPDKEVDRLGGVSERNSQAASDEKNED